MFDWVAPMFKRILNGLVLAVLFSLAFWLGLFLLLRARSR